MKSKARQVPTKVRLCRWGDFSDKEAGEIAVKYGIQAYVAPHGYIHVSRSGSVLLFDAVENAAAEMDRLAEKWGAQKMRPAGGM